MIYDAAIVGTGPAGAMAATQLTRAGARVILVDKQILPRYKTCGGGVVYRARRLMPIDIEPVVEQACHRVLMSCPTSNICFTTERTKPIVSMVMRAPLDHLLVTAAQQHGAELLTGQTVKGLERNPAYLRLILDKQTLDARTVIAADGASSQLAKLAGWHTDTRQLVPALEAEVKVAPASYEIFRQQARFDFDQPPHGYGWVFPKQERLSVGVGMFSVNHSARQLRQALMTYLDRLGLKPLQLEQHGYVIPVRPRRDGFVRDRVYLIGDAAGFADPVTAEGITAALQSGKLVAEALIASGFEHEQAERAYISLVATQLLPEIRTAGLLARFLYGLPALRNWAFRRYGQRLANAVTDVFMGERTYRASMSNPRNYLRLLGLC